MKSFLSDAERIRLLEANVTDYAIFMIDTDERIASWNSGAERILGYADADIIGQPASIIFTHEDRESEAEQKEFLAARETGCADDERWHLRKDGSRLWALGILTALYDEQGQLQGYAKILRDFTARKQYEERIEALNARLQWAMTETHHRVKNNLQLISAIIDFQTLGHGDSVPLVEYKHLGNQVRILAATPEAGLTVTTAPTGWRDFTVAVQDGRVLDLSWATVRLSDGTCIGIAQDITQRKREEALTGQYTAQIETRVLRLEQAMRETNHRIKNNLQSVAALLDMQVMDHEAMVLFQELTQVRMHINTLATIHDMLVTDVKENGSASVLSTKASLLKLLPMLQKIVGAERIRRSVDEVDLPIKQGMSLAVLVNELVHNAVKHGGHKVELSLAVVEKEVTLEVLDDGPGFPLPFSPLTAGGFGLELVESVGRLDLGGVTTYENRPDGGACIRVIFPLPQMQGVWTS